jgi:hypothetical protein
MWAVFVVFLFHHHHSLVDSLHKCLLTDPSIPAAKLEVIVFSKKTKIISLFDWLVADGWCWFVLREEYCWLVSGGWFVLREKYCWLVADKPSE